MSKLCTGKVFACVVLGSVAVLILACLVPFQSGNHAATPTLHRADVTESMLESGGYSGSRHRLQHGVECPAEQPLYRSETLDPAAELAALEEWINGGRQRLDFLQEIAQDKRKSARKRLRAARALAAIGSHEALQSLFDAIWSEEDAATRHMLISALDSFSEVDSVDSLVSLLLEPEEPEVHAAVIDAISRLAQPTTVEYLAQSLSAKSSRAVACLPVFQALSSIRNEESIPALASLMSRADAASPVRQAAATSLGKMGTKECLLHLAGLGVGGSEPDVLRIQVLSSIQDPAAVSSLKTLKKVSTNLQVAGAISQSLATIRAEHSAAP